MRLPSLSSLLLYVPRPLYPSICSTVRETSPRMLQRGEPAAAGEVRTFAELGLRHELSAALPFTAPLEIQRLAWPHLAGGADAILVSEAGSGKTLAYLLPLLHAMLERAGGGEQIGRAGGGEAPSPSRTGRLLLVVPTSVLCEQLLAQARALLQCSPLSVAAASSDHARGSHVVVGTATAVEGLLSGWRRREGRLHVVFDECDLLLAGVMKKGKQAAALPASNVLSLARPRKRPRRREGEAEPQESPPQLIFASATVPGQGRHSVGAFLARDVPDAVWVRSSGAHRPVAALQTEFVRVADDAERAAELLKQVRGREGRTLVFANSASRAARVAEQLRASGCSCFAFHPSLSAGEREAALAGFGEDERGVLACSGLAARGLDLAGVVLVVQQQLAPHMVEYMHRVGRTARGVSAAGRAVSLVDSQSEAELALVREVERCVSGSWKFV
mmetsp:Transcript_16736/g.54808  ORF Transcript_16736/g.54808 Transcript_16736/m.54808 type:complete len:446 (-) Transcript_16736:89-1426(-)